jgi:hypothetical protein
MLSMRYRKKEGNNFLLPGIEEFRLEKRLFLECENHFFEYEFDRNV